MNLLNFLINYSIRFLEFDPYRRWEELSSSYRHYEWNDIKRDSPELLAALRVVRDDPGWKAFVHALNTCDQSVNNLLEQNIVDWTNAGSKIALINAARNAWRRACWVRSCLMRAARSLILLK